MVERRFKVAAVQMLSFEGEQERNLSRMLGRIAEAAAAGARLIVFPEASNNGYFFELARIAWAVLHKGRAFECVKTNAPRPA